MHRFIFEIFKVSYIYIYMYISPSTIMLGFIVIAAFLAGKTSHVQHRSHLQPHSHLQPL